MSSSTPIFRILLLTMIPLLGLSYIIHTQLNDYTPPVVDKLPALLVDDTLKADVFPTIMVENDEGKSLPIQLSDLKIDVKVIGNIATTTMEMTFYNDSSVILEGQLYFPLGEGQSVSRFAMDVEGKLREGVIVEKEKGQAVFESIVRRNVDPGLLEWTKGNNFKARVYPIPSKGHKRIVVAYEQELDQLEQGYLYLLPLNFKEKVDQFDLRVEVFNQAIKPTLEKNTLVNLEFEKWEENYVASLSKKNFLPDSQIGLTVPTPKNVQQIYTEKVPGTENQYYYYTTLTPRKGKVEIKAPSSIGLVWDASTSGKNRDIERELSLLDNYFAQNKNVTVKFISLRNTAKMVKSYPVKNGDWSALRTRIKEIPFDGASAYESIDYSKYPCDVFLLFGDGLSNFGLKNGKLPKVAVNTINSSASANHSYLKYLSSATGGEYINLLKTENTAAVELLRGGNFQYYGNGQENTYPSMPTTVQNQVHVAGIITGKTELDFSFGSGEPSSQIHTAIDPEAHLTNTGLLRRIWAQKKLAELDINPDKNDEAITALGMEFGIVTRNTSLIVLDRVEDYVEHEIVPPTELQQEYYAQLKEIKKNTDAEQAAHIRQVKEDFKAYVDWWNTDYDIAKILAEDKKVAAISDSERNFRGDSLVINQNMEQPVMNMSEISMEEDASYAFTTDAVGNGSVSAQPNAVGAKDAGRTEGKKNAEIQLEKWEPDAPYMKALKKASDETLYSIYLGLKKENSSTPSFFLDVSDLFIEKGEKDLALRILSNIAEMDLESHELLRVLAHRLEQLEYYELAVMIYGEVARIRQEEPQSFRDLGLCLAKEGSYQEAVDMLYKVVENTWDGRFPGIESIVLTEINQIVALHKNKVNTERIDPEFLKDLPVDVRVILNWDSDNCDMDLWVTDPRKEKCFYSNKNTKIGGRISNDFTRGYGPEMFTIKNAMKGKYVVQINYYGTSTQRISGPTTIQIQLVTNYGRPNEKVQEITRRLSSQQEVLDIGSLIFE